MTYKHKQGGYTISGWAYDNLSTYLQADYEVYIEPNDDSNEIAFPLGVFGALDYGDMPIGLDSSKSGGFDNVMDTGGDFGGGGASGAW